MRESSLESLYERRCVLLTQLSAALRGRIVALWRVARGGLAMTEAVSRPQPSGGALEFDVGGMLRQWGRSALPHSLWLGCRVDTDRWHVAAVRTDPPAPPPHGVERRSPERLVVELGGLCLGAHERAWAAVDQVTVYLSSALELLDTALARVRSIDDLPPLARAQILGDLVGISEVVNTALQA